MEKVYAIMFQDNVVARFASAELASVNCVAMRKNGWLGAWVTLL